MTLIAYTGADESTRLLQKDIEGGFYRNIAQRLNECAQRAHAAHDESHVRGSLAGDDGGSTIDLGNVRAGVELRKRDPVCPKGICRQQLRPCIYVCAMHGGDFLRMFEVPEFTTRTGIESSLLKLGADGSVGDQNTSPNGFQQAGTHISSNHIFRQLP